MNSHQEISKQQQNEWPYRSYEAIDRHSLEQQVKPYWDDYEDALDDYNDYVGGGVDTDIYSETVPNEDRPWDGLTNDFDGYNRINELSSKVIREARGYS